MEASLGAKMSQQVNSAHQTKLAKEIWDHDHALIIHGLKNSSLDDIKNFFRVDLKIPAEAFEKFRIMEVIRLGKDTDETRVPPISVRFAHPTQRNNALTYSKNLKREKGIKIDKSVPKSYKDMYQAFKKQAWKLKLMHGYQTQVIFLEHKLLLRYKIKDEDSAKYDYIIYDEWNGPSPGAVHVAKI